MALAPLTILHHDDELVAIDKPSGLAVHRGWARGERFAMTELRDQLGRWVYPVHRLDQAASGVLLFALSSEVAREVCARFERHEVEKRYLALVRGAPPDAIRIDHPLRPERGDVAQAACTDVQRLAQWGRYAWVEARPQTGRLHQIRRHLKHLSCPIIGDVRYGKGEHNRLFRERYALHRLALHAAELKIRSLRGDGWLAIRAALPDDLSRAIEALEGSTRSPHPAVSPRCG